MKPLLYIGCCLFSLLLDAQEKSVLYMGAHLHLGNGEEIKNGAIGFKDGKIILVKNAYFVKDKTGEFDEVINAEGKHIYPGFIALNTYIGLTDIKGIRADNDHEETGLFNPNVRSIVAYNAESIIIPTVRSNGVLIGQLTPRGGIISGSSSVVKFSGNNWQDALVKANEGIHLQWPTRYNITKAATEENITKAHKAQEEKVEKVHTFFTEAKGYHTTSYPLKKNLRYEALKGVLDGTQTLYVHADYARDITEAIYFCRSFDLKKVVLVGGYDAWKVQNLIKDNNIPVIVRRPHSLPQYPHDDIDQPYKTAAQLVKKGILVAIDSDGPQAAISVRNIPFFAGTARAYGLTEEEAIATISGNAAKILSVDDRLGTLEVGKSATLFISSGDALDMKSNKVEKAYIDGIEISLKSIQTELYERYK